MSAERMERYRLNHKKFGRIKRDMYLTDEEFEALKVKLKEIRLNKPVSNIK